MADINPYFSPNAQIVAALKNIVPIEHTQYTGTADTYATFVFYNRLPEVMASGKNHRQGAYGDIDVFSDADLSSSSSIIATIASALNSEGVTVKNIRDTVYDSVKHHVVIEFYISKER